MNDNRHGCWVAVLFVAATMAWAGSPLDAGDIRIWPTAVVTGDSVALADIAEIRGFDPATTAQLEAVEVETSPQRGREALVRIDDVRQAMKDAGMDLGIITLYGSSRCKISRPRHARVVVERRSHRSSRQPVPTSNKKLVSAQNNKSTFPREDSQARDSGIVMLDRQAKTEAPAPVIGVCTLESLVRRHIEARVPGRDAKTEIRFSKGTLRHLRRCGVDGKIEIRPRGDRWLGLISLDVDITGGSGATRTIPVIAEVWLVKSIVVARRPINRGQTIRARDVKLEERRFTSLGDIGLTDLSFVVGQECGRFIRAGELLHAKWIKEKPVVRRGEQVTIWLRRGGVVLRASGLAQQSGALGERIEVRRDGVKRKQDLIDAVVTGPGTVTIGGPRQVAGLFWE